MVHESSTITNQYFGCSNQVSEGLEMRLELDPKPLTGMAATSAPQPAQKRGHDEESVVSLDNEGGTKSSGLSVLEAKAIIKAGFKEVLGRTPPLITTAAAH